MSITSEEVNFLVYRYLQESGFTHAAFALSHEGLVGRSDINGALVPPGALITALQKGLQFQEIEAHLAAGGSETERPERLSLVIPPVLKKNRRGGLGAGDGAATSAEQEEALRRRAQREAKEVQRSEVTTLVGHASEVFSCAWSPTVPILATGSSDATARMWSIPPVPSGKDVAVDPPVVLHHRSEAKARDVTSLHWSLDGSRLATGSVDGRVRVFSASGQPLQTMEGHHGPVFALRWNRKGDSLLSGSADNVAIIWDPSTGAAKQKFEFHEAAVLDVAWRNDTTFASCAMNGVIHVAQLGSLKPLRTFRGHDSEVNAIAWDPAGQHLASCSDDFSTKVWSMDSDDPVHHFKDHKKEVYALTWSATGPGTKNEALPLMLATASFDATVRVYDVVVGVCLFCLSQPHTGPVYAVDFSPDGAYLATGSFDHSLCVWSALDGALHSVFKSGGGVLDVKFNNAGNKVAACLSNNTIAVIDFKPGDKDGSGLGGGARS